MQGHVMRVWKRERCMAACTALLVSEPSPEEYKNKNLLIVCRQIFNDADATEVKDPGAEAASGGRMARACVRAVQRET